MFTQSPTPPPTQFLPLTSPETQNILWGSCTHRVSCSSGFPGATWALCPPSGLAGRASDFNSLRPGGGQWTVQLRQLFLPQHNPGVLPTPWPCHHHRHRHCRSCPRFPAQLRLNPSVALGLRGQETDNPAKANNQAPRRCPGRSRPGARTDVLCEAAGTECTSPRHQAALVWGPLEAGSVESAAEITRTVWVSRKHSSHPRPSPLRSTRSRWTLGRPTAPGSRLTTAGS